MLDETRRRLSDEDFQAVYYVELFPSVPMFQFVEAVKSLDDRSFGSCGGVTCSETEMVGGNGHTVIVCTTQSVLHALENEKHVIRRFIPFPDVSKITMSLIEAMEEEIEQPFLISIRCMGDYDEEQLIKQWKEALQHVVYHPDEETDVSVMDTILQWSETIEEADYEVATEPQRNVPILYSDGLFL